MSQTSEKTNLIMNKNNYNKYLKDIDNIAFEYVKILHEYLTHITKTINITSEKHYRYIILRGYDLLKNVFLFLMFYTKNVTLVCHHLRKSYLYYTEFIGQIGEDSNSYLQLNSKDACLFVYKKTIHDINEDFRKKHVLMEKDLKTNEELKEKILLINRIESLFIKKNIIYFLDKDSENDIVKNIRVHMIKILDEINNIKKDKLKKINKINIFLDYLEYNFKILSTTKIFNLIFYFIKKNNKNVIEVNKLKKINILYNIDILDTISGQKFINKLFRH